MKTKRFLPEIIALSTLFGPVVMMAAPASRILTEPAEIQGIPCRGKVELNENGRIKSCTLARNYPVAGYSLQAGTELRFNEAGELASFILTQSAVFAGFMLPTGSKVDLGGPQGAMCSLSQDTLIRGVPLPAHSVLFFNTNPGWEREVPNTWQCWMPKETLIQGHLCASIEDACGQIFYSSGKLRAAHLAADEEIDGVPCTSSYNVFRLGVRVLSYGLDHRAWFYENGHLAQGLVSRDCTLEGRKFKPGDVVRLTRDGKLDVTANTTLGAYSRLAEKRTPPESFIPRSEDAHATRSTDSH